MSLVTFVKYKSNFRSVWLSVGTVLAGTAAAVIRGNMELLPAIICIIFAIFAQLAANLYHSWYTMRKENEIMFPNDSLDRIDLDDRSTDRGNPFLIRVLREAMIASVLISAMAGLALLTLADRWLWFAVMGIFIYAQFVLVHVGKRPLVNTPVSMVLTFLIFGPIGVMSTSLIQSQREAIGNIWSFFDTAPSLFIGPAAGFLALTVHYLFSYANYLTAPTFNPKSLTNLVKPAGIRLMTFFNGIAMFACMIAMVIVLRLPNPIILLLPAFIGFTLNTHITVLMNKNMPLSRINHMYVLALSNYVLTFGLTFLLFLFVAPPDDSHILIF